MLFIQLCLRPFHTGVVYIWDASNPLSQCAETKSNSHLFAHARRPTTAHVWTVTKFQKNRSVSEPMENI